MSETNYTNEPITEQESHRWNDITVRHEITMTSEVLLGIPKYNMDGMFASHGPNNPSTKVWITRYENVVREARRRWPDDEELMKELDALDFVIELELV